MPPHATKISPEPWLEIRPRRGIERLTRAAQHIMHAGGGLPPEPLRAPARAPDPRSMPRPRAATEAGSSLDCRSSMGAVAPVRAQSGQAVAPQPRGIEVPRTLSLALRQAEQT